MLLHAMFDISTPPPPPHHHHHNDNSSSITISSRQRPNFISRFILGPSFAEAELTNLSATLSSLPEKAADALLSGFLACSGRFFSLVYHQGNYSDGESGTGTGTGMKEHEGGDYYAYSAKAVRGLRGLELGLGGDLATGIGKRERERKRKKQQQGRGDNVAVVASADLVLALVLGLGVVTFDLLDSGLHAHSICRYTLGLVSRPSVGLDSDYDGGGGGGRGGEFESQLLPLIHMDSCNCLVRRQVPAYRLRPRRPEGVDRYIGLCVSLLPVVYDLCCVSSRLGGVDDGSGVLTAGKSYEEDDGLSGVETAVRNWSPSLRKEDAAKLTPTEIQVIVTQATVYQTAVLLFIHRLRFPFGVEDEMATSMAASILDDVRSLYHAPGHRGSEAGRDQNSIPFEYRMGLPFLIAAAELQDGIQRTQALELLDWVVWKRMYPRVGDLLRRFVLYVWEARDRGWQGHWVDLTARGPQFVLF